MPGRVLVRRCPPRNLLPAAAVSMNAADLALELARRAETDPDDELLVAARIALEIGDARRAEHRAHREAARDVHRGDRAFWRQVADNHIPHQELERRRAEPGPMVRRTV